MQVPRTMLSALILSGFLWAGCGSPPSDPALQILNRVIEGGERLILLRSLDTGRASAPEDRFIAVVRPGKGGPELRVYEVRSAGVDLLYTTRQGDSFREVALVDVIADGRAEIVSTWGGGHLEFIEVTGRREGGTYAPLFQNAGREVERRLGPGGMTDFLITSRTYEELVGQPPAYETALYRWNGETFAETGS